MSVKFPSSDSGSWGNCSQKHRNRRIMVGETTLKSPDSDPSPGISSQVWAGVLLPHLKRYCFNSVCFNCKLQTHAASMSSMDNLESCKQLQIPYFTNAPTCPCKPRPLQSSTTRELQKSFFKFQASNSPLHGRSRRLQMIHRRSRRWSKERHPVRPSP